MPQMLLTASQLRPGRSDTLVKSYVTNMLCRQPVLSSSSRWAGGQPGQVRPGSFSPSVHVSPGSGERERAGSRDKQGNIENNRDNLTIEFNS